MSNNLAFNVMLTSFNEAKKLKCGNKFSVARTKPQWAKNYQELMFLAPFDPEGNAITLRRFPHDPTGGYAAELKRAYLSRWHKIDEWLRGLDVTRQYVLCCWCPHSSTSKRQIQEYGTFACHTLLIAKMIRKNRPDLVVKIDDAREQQGLLDWK